MLPAAPVTATRMGVLLIVLNCSVWVCFVYWASFGEMIFQGHSKISLCALWLPAQASLWKFVFNESSTFTLCRYLRGIKPAFDCYSAWATWEFAELGRDVEAARA